MSDFVSLPSLVLDRSCQQRATSGHLDPVEPVYPSISQLFLPLESRLQQRFSSSSPQRFISAPPQNFGDGLYHVGVASHNHSQSIRDLLLCDAGCALIGSASAPISAPSAVSFGDHGGVGGGAVSYPAEEVTSLYGGPTCSVDFHLLRQAQHWILQSINKCFKIRVLTLHQHGNSRNILMP